MFHRFGRVIIMLIVSTALGMPQGHGQDARAAGEAAPAALERQSAGLPEVLTLATAHTSAGRFAEGHQVLETASTPETQHALRLALAALHVTWAHHLAQRFAYTDARAQYQAALALRRAVGDQAGEGTLLDRLGTTHRVQSQYREAIAYFAQALERQRAVGDRTGESATLTHLGEACSGLSQFPQAIATYEQALALARDTGNRLGEGTLLEHLGAVAVAVGQYPQALTYIEQALDIAREVGDWAGEGTALTTLGEMQRDAQLNADLKIANEAFQTLLKDLRAAFSSTPTSGNRLADVQKEVGFQADLANLGPGTVLLYTVVTATHYRVIVITPETQVARDYPITAAALNCKVQAFRETLRTLKDGVPEFDPRPLAQELYQILFVPVARDLHGAQAQTLLWNLDGVLRYLPVAALYDGERYLVERYRTVVYTDVSRARLKDLPQPTWTGVGLGVSQAHDPFAALPAVPAELRGIIRDTAHATEGVLSGIIKLDQDFTDETMTTALQEGHPVVHIASHFHLHPGNNTASFLLLGDGTHLSLAELHKKPALFHGVDLLTLSACDTAMGDITATGQEIDGFAMQAQQQGAKAVIASLWPVADASTKDLMQTLYRLWERQAGLPKVEALRQAQLALLRGQESLEPNAPVAASGALLVASALEATASRGPDVAPEPQRQDVCRDGPVALRFRPSARAPYAHPFYWAPFILIGNWK